MSFRPPRFYKYLLGEFVPLYVIGLLAIMLLLISDYCASTAGVVLRQHAPLGLFLESLLNYIPYRLSYALAPSVAWAVLVGLGRIAKDSELKAAFACGIKPISMLVPIILFGIVITLLGFWNSNYITPGASARWQSSFWRLYGASTTNNTQMLKSFADPKNKLLFHAASIVPSTQTNSPSLSQAQLMGVMVIDNQTVYTSESGTWDAKNKTWLLINPVAQSLNTNSEAQQLSNKAFPFAFNLETDPKPPEQLELPALLAHSRDPALSRDDRYAAIFNLQRRFSDPLAALIFALVGGAFGLMISNRAWGFAGMIVLTMCYWALWTFGTKLAATQGTGVFVAAWLPSIVFTIAAAFAWRRLL